MKIVVTVIRDISNVTGGVETHCEELFPCIARRGFDMIVVYRKNYVQYGLQRVHYDMEKYEWNKKQSK